MLYQTLPLLNSHTIPSSSSSSFTDISPLLSRPQSLGSLRKMESVELALTNSNRKEKALTGGAQNGEAFSVDDLLDFPNDDVLSADDDSEMKLLQRNKGDSVPLNDENTLPRGDDVSAALQRNKGDSVPFNDENTLPRSDDVSTAGEDLGSFPTSGLAVPMDDLPELEWLSNFVEDSSFTTYSPPAEKPVWLTGDRKHPVPPVNDESCLKPPLPVKTRAKPARTGVTFLTDSSSSSTTSSSSSSGLPCLSGAEFLHKPMAKKQKKKKLQTLSQAQTQTQTRKCSHCGAQKTPQWREGPMGLKTLCNACGVRFKSGRLLPEYRPACSPTFSSELHSNHHRKVVEMRRQKEKSDDADETGLNQSVQVVPTF